MPEPLIPAPGWAGLSCQVPASLLRSSLVRRNHPSCNGCPEHAGGFGSMMCDRRRKPPSPCGGGPAMSESLHEDDVAQLRAEIDALKAQRSEVDGLRAQLTSLTALLVDGAQGVEVNGGAGDDPEKRTDRRGMFKVAGA